MKISSIFAHIPYKKYLAGFLVAVILISQTIHVDFFNDSLQVESKLDAHYANYFEAESKVYLKGTEKMQASAIFQKDNNGLSIGFTLSGESGNSMIAIINHVPENFTLPLTGNFAVSQRYDGKNPVATLMYMNVTENNMGTSEVPYEGEMTITKLTKNEMIFTINGKGGDITDADSPSNWKTITGKAKLTSPIIQSYGVDKNNVLK